MSEHLDQQPPITEQPATVPPAPRVEASHPGPIPPVPSVPSASEPPRRQRLWPVFLVGLVAALLGIAIGAGLVWGIASSGGTAVPDGSAQLVADRSAATQSTTINVTGEDTSVAEAVSRKCLPSVVSIITSVTSSSSSFSSGSSTEASGLGSGVILTSDGYILTNFHVIEGADAISVTIDGTSYDAVLVGSDESSDLAVIKIDATGLTPMEIGSSSDLDVGEWVATIGSPFGLDKSVATGVVSALSRSEGFANQTGLTIYANLIQTDASINPGNSGGALVDQQGRLVGITTLYSSSTTSSANVGFAIPVDYAYRVARQIMDGETVTHAYLGTSLASVTENNAKRNGLSVTAGAYVSSVASGSAAEQGGLQSGDVIVAADGSAVESAYELIIAVRSHEPGDTMQVTYVRDGSEHAVTVTLGSDDGARS